MKREERKKKRIDGEGKKGGDKKMEIFPAFRLSNPDDPRVKVDPRIESYA